MGKRRTDGPYHRTTLTIPAELNERLMRERPLLNWSKVATDALRCVLEESPEEFYICELQRLREENTRLRSRLAGIYRLARNGDDK